MHREATSESARVYLSPPHMSGHEVAYVQEAFQTNWIAPLGPNVDAFEREFCQVVGSGHALAILVRNDERIYGRPVPITTSKKG